MTDIDKDITPVVFRVWREVTLLNLKD